MVFFMKARLRRLALIGGIFLLAVLPSRAAGVWVIDFEGQEVFLNLQPSTLPEVKGRLEKEIKESGPLKAVYFRFGADQSTDELVKLMFDFHQLDIESYVLIATAADGTETTLTYDRAGNLIGREQKAAPGER